jgi:hypothetical protein
MLVAGPNGQGVVSTPVRLCAQIVAPYPPAGRIGVASQSGNFVSSFMNLARSTGVGISRAVSAGNAAAVGVADYLSFVIQVIGNTSLTSERPKIGLLTLFPQRGSSFPDRLHLIPTDVSQCIDTRTYIGILIVQ